MEETLESLALAFLKVFHSLYGGDEYFIKVFPHSFSYFHFSNIFYFLYSFFCIVIHSRHFIPFSQFCFIFIFWNISVYILAKKNPKPVKHWQKECTIRKQAITRNICSIFIVAWYLWRESRCLIRQRTYADMIKLQITKELLSFLIMTFILEESQSMFP